VFVLTYVVPLPYLYLLVNTLYVVCDTYLFPPCNFYIRLFLTMAKKKVQLYASDEVLTDFYNALANNDPRSMRKVHIPKSDVFYVREAIHNRTGDLYTLDHVERAMYLEGHLTRQEVLDPDREREYG